MNVSSTYEPTDPASWDAEFTAGRWAYLHDSGEAPRYAEIASLVLQCNPRSIVDLGCGEGILEGDLRRFGYQGVYVGLDWSVAALPRSSAPNSLFVCGSVCSIPLDATFDVAVLSEVLYYVDDPAAVLEHARAKVSIGGTIVISLYLPDELRHPLWASRIHRICDLIESAHAVVPRTIVAATRKWRLYSTHSAYPARSSSR